MDHLPWISNPKKNVLRAPYLYGEPFVYDGKGLHGFPERCGYNIPRTTGAANLDYWDHDATAFFQTWLFFGTLCDILNLYNIRLLCDDFKRTEGPQNLLCTTMLTDYLAAWIANASREAPLCLHKSRPITNQMTHIMKDAISLRKIASRQPDRVQFPAPQIVQDKMRGIRGILETALNVIRLESQNRAIHSHVWESVLILCSTLYNSARYLYRAYDYDYEVSDMFSSIPSRLAQTWFESAGWCMREQAIVRAILNGNVSVLLLCSQLDRRQKGFSHDTCSDKLCTAYQVDENQYETAHIDEKCPCSLIDVHEALSSSSAYQQSGYRPHKLRPIPLITYRNGNINVHLMAPLEADVRRWTAERFQSDAFYVAISHVWAHRRGNPKANALPHCQLEFIQNLSNELFPPEKWPVPFWMDTLCVPVAREGRKDAIRSMEWIYKSATKVLVVDDALMRTPTKNVAPEEIGLQILCSAWSRRLWTLQEAMQVDRIHYKFADATYTYPFLDDLIKKREAFPSRARSIPQGHLLHSVLDNPPHCSGLSTPLRDHAHKILSCWSPIASFFKEMDSTYHRWKYEEAYLLGVIRSVSTRTTSHLEDEALVLAGVSNLLAGSAHSLLDIIPSERIRHFFNHRGLYGGVPSQLIFFDQTRYPEEGSRWIPTSVLTQGLPSSSIPRLSSGEIGIPTTTLSKGLYCCYPGVLITIHNPGLSFPTCFTIEINSQRYKAHVREAGTTKPAEGLQPQRPALILQRSLATQRATARTAVLADIKNWDSIERIRRQLKMPDYVLRVESVSKARKALMLLGGNLELTHNFRAIRARHEALVDLVPDHAANSSGIPQAEARQIYLPTIYDGQVIPLPGNMTDCSAWIVG